MIYLDNAATTKPLDASVKAVYLSLEQSFGNPSSLHSFGLKSEKVIDKTRELIATTMKCDDQNIYFNSCATEGNNTAIFGVAKNYGRRKKRIVTSSIEHPSVSEPLKQLELEGFEIIRISPNSDGNILADDFIKAINEDTFLISCMYVNNETGYILPVQEIFSRAKRKNPEIITHCDAVQAFLKIDINVNKLCADIITFSGHKVNAPKGVGAMYIKKSVRVAPLIHGGGQERKLRSGTEAVPLISGLFESVGTLSRNISERLSYIKSLKDALLKGVENKSYIKVVSNELCSPYIVSISVIGIKSEIMLHFLESKDIYVSSGSACSKGEKSEVLKAFCVGEDQLDSTIRIAFSHENTVAEIDALISAIDEGYSNLQKVRLR